ncbi:MAG: stage II sporulation protein D [Christensenellales bacterium]|jgi:stage II sporulation protein D
MRRMRRLTPEGMALLGIVLFVLLAVLYPAITVLTRGAPPTAGQPGTGSPGSPDFEVIGKKKETNPTIEVWLDGTLTEMKLEDYLIGVVAAEMPASFELEALKAQAVAARTYTLYKRDHGGCSAHEGADICTNSNHCQAYVTDEEMTKNWGSKKAEYLVKITEAVTSTAGKAIYYEGETIQVFYFASAGDRTEDSENVYSKALPYLRSVVSEGEENSSHYYGKVTVSIDDFKKKMKKFSPGVSFNGVPLIGEITRFDSGRVQSIRIGSQSFTGREVREAFSLNSANFTIEQTKDSITFHTIGFGHGVGMSQTGANAMAKKGADYIDILTHYFTGVTVG